MSDAARRYERELSAADRARLEEAHRVLRDAVAAYEQFLGGPLDPNQPVPVHDAGAMKAAQEAVAAAEDRLWHLREELLGWTRPSWAPGAALTSDWFSEEDSVYDDVPETSASQLPPARGDIVLVPFPYSDLRGMKRRPACVVSADGYQHGPDVIVAMVTSQTVRQQAPGLGDVVVTDWQAAGLRAPSTIRCGRLLVLQQSLLGTTLGRLSAATLADVDDALRTVFGLR